MFIQTEATPNPATLKFLPGRPVLADGVLDIPDAADAAKSPLAERLFAVPGVAGVFLGSDFITVTKSGVEWQQIKPAILGAIMEHFMSGAPITKAAAQASDAADEFFDSNDAETVVKSHVEGVELTERELLKVMEKHGIKKFDPQGQKFDPNLHQAMLEIPDPSVPSGTVVQVMQPGYMIADRVLRPALVGVAKGGPKAAPAANENAASAQPDSVDTQA